MWNISGGSERIPGWLGQLSQMMKLRIKGVNSYDYLTLQAQDCTPPNLRVSVDIFTDRVAARAGW